MASSTAAVPPLSELSGVIEELRRQLASANDAQLASEVGHQHQTVLSNIMLTGQESGQVAPPEDLEKGSSGVAKATAFSPVSNFKNGTDHNTSTDAQTAPPASAPEQISAGSDFISHHNQTPFNGQILTPDIHLAQAVQLAATPQSQPEQFSPGGEPQTAIVDINDARSPLFPLPISPPMRMRASVSPCRPTALSMWMWATSLPCQPHLPTAARCPPGSASIR